MDFYKAIQAAVQAAGADGLLETLPPNRWDKVSINGKPSATVLAHGVGLKDGTAWTYFTFRLDASGTIQTIWAEKGPSGAPRIWLADGPANEAQKGTLMKGAHIQVEPVVQGFTLKVSLRLSFTTPDGQPVEYRFDGRSWP